MLIKFLILPAHSSTDGKSESVFRRLWRGAPFGLGLVMFLELFVVPAAAPFFAPFSEVGGNSWTTLGIDLAHAMHGLSWSNSQGYTFVDVDNDTFSSWGKSGYTDRSKLAELLCKIVGASNNNTDNKSQAIVVDIDLSAPSADKTNIDGELDPLSLPCLEDGAHYVGEDKKSTSDGILTAYILDYSNQNPPLIFVRLFRDKPKNLKAGPLYTIEAQLKTDSPIYFASAGFLRSADGLVRSWRLGRTCLHRRSA